MHRIFLNLIVKKAKFKSANPVLLQRALKLSDNVKTNQLELTGEEDRFGIGGKYSDLDSVKSIRKSFSTKNTKNLVDNADRFGTLANQLDSV